MRESQYGFATQSEGMKQLSEPVPPPAALYRSARIALALSALLVLLLPLLAAPASAQSTLFQIVQLTAGVADPVGITNAGDGSGRLFIVEQRGRIRVWTGTALLTTPFLDLTGQVGPCGSPPGCGERGLLGLAFHPDYETNGLFYVYYTRAGTGDTAGDITISRYSVSGNPNIANTTGTVLLTIEHSSQGNHNGGQLAFGPDGYLYAGIGDGGGGGDPFETGQDVNALLGKILRLDVDGDDFPTDPNRNYAIPADNPFAATTGADEVWAYGKRNPWRFSFDRLTEDLWIADVGQGLFEEINREPAGSAGGVNYGWDCREGAHVYTGTDNDGNAGCDGLTFVDPVVEYGHTGGRCSVTGGFVYRGRVNSFLSGQFVYADFCTGELWRAMPGSGGTFSQVLIQDTPFNISSFGESETGRLYFTHLGGSVQWIAPYTFADVLPTNSFWRFVEAIFAAGVTSGCGGNNFCPNSATTREQVAPFLLRALEGPSYTPPPCTTPVFNDVPCTSPSAAFINELAARSVTAGCGGGNYCPTRPLNRGEMAVFLLRTLEGPTYTPPACTTPTFNDVPCSHPFARWINELAARGVTAGCGGGNYCPGNPVSRAQMAVFLTVNFDLGMNVP
jgi:glucose/arabinose dehydrogenase